MVPMRITPAALALLLLAPAACKKYDRAKDDPGAAPEPAAAAAPTGAAAEPAAAPPPSTKPMPAKKKAPAPEELRLVQAERDRRGHQGADDARRPQRDQRELLDEGRGQEEHDGRRGLRGELPRARHQFSMIPGGKKDGMPFKPARSYTFTKGTGDASVMTIFGEEHARRDRRHRPRHRVRRAPHHAGEIALKGKLVPGGGEVKLTGSFDLICPGFGGCAGNQAQQGQP